MDLKRCSKCGTYFLRSTDYFVRDKKRKDGLKPSCKQCDRKYYLSHKEVICARAKEHRENNKEKIAQYFKDYYLKNKQSLADYKKEYAKKNSDKLREYREANREKRIQQKREWDKRNEEWRKEYTMMYKEKCKDEILKRRIARREELRQKSREFREKFPEKRRESVRKYYETHRDEISIRKHKRIARERSLPRNFSKADWEECLDFFDYKDAYTGLPMKRPTQDHIIPVSKGGGYVKSNIVPCDYHINASKQNQDMEEWYIKQPFFSEERLMKIYEWMNKGVSEKWLTSF